MWYHAIPRDWDCQRDMSPIAYAEPADGITWTKPALGIPPTPSTSAFLRLESTRVYAYEVRPVG